MFWISELDADTLLERFNITGLVLEELTRAISRSGRNQLLKNYAGLDPLLPLAVNLTGTRSGARRNAALRLRVGDELRLDRDYDNGLDRNAVEAKQSGRVAGYLPRHVAQVLAPELDAGTSFKAIVTAANKTDITVAIDFLTQF